MASKHNHKNSRTQTHYSEEDDEDGLILKPPTDAHHQSTRHRERSSVASSSTSPSSIGSSSGAASTVETDRKHHGKLSLLVAEGGKHRGSHAGRKSLYRCDLEALVEKVFRWTGVDVDGSEIFVVNGGRRSVFNVNGGFVGDIQCRELKSGWNVRVFDNRLYVSDNAKDKKLTLIMDKTGHVQSKLGLPGKEVGLDVRPLGLAIDDITKDIFMSSEISDTIYKCPNGSTHFKPFITSGLSHPAYLCVGHRHEVIASNAGSHTVAKYDEDGVLIWRYGGEGTGNGQLYRPLGVCVDPWGNVYVADYWNNRVVQITPSGKFAVNINIVEVIERPQALVFRENRLIITTGLLKEKLNENKIFVVKCQYVSHT